MSSQRDTSLDAFKGFCLALVICIHLKCKGGLWLAPWANPFKLAGFFVVSGYLLSLKPPIGPADAAKKLARRWRGIMIPYFTFSVLALAVLVPWHARTLADATSLANGMIAKTVLLRGHSTLWFLPVLFLAEAFFLGTLALEGRLRRRAGRAAWLVHPLSLAGAIGLSLVLSPLAQPLIKVPANRQLAANLLLPWLRALPAFACVAAGYFAYGKLLSACSRRAGWLAGASAAFVLAGFAAGRMLGNVNWNDNVYGGNPCLFLFSGIASSFGLMLGFKWLSRFLSMPVLRFIGVNSLVLMATHLPLPIVKFAKEAAAWVAGCLPAFGGVLARHPLADCLWRLAIVLAMELPIVLLFMHTPLKVLLGKPAARSRPLPVPRDGAGNGPAAGPRA